MRNISLDIFPGKASAKIAQIKLSGLVALQHMGNVLLPWRLLRRSSLRIPHPNSTSLQHCVVRREDYVTCDPTPSLLTPRRNFNRSLGFGTYSLAFACLDSFNDFFDPWTHDHESQTTARQRGECGKSAPLALNFLMSSLDNSDITFCDEFLILGISS